MTVSLPYPVVVTEDGQGLDAQGVQGNFDALAGATPSLRVMAGIVYPAYTASPTTATVTITHGFGRAPVSIVATSGNGGHIAHGSGSASNLTVFSETRDGSSATGAVSVNYVAVF